MLNLDSSPAKRANDLPFATAGDCDWDGTRRACIVNDDGDLVATVSGKDGEKQAQSIAMACNAYDFLVDALNALAESDAVVPGPVRTRINNALAAAGVEPPVWRDQVERNVKLAAFDILLNTAVAATSMLRLSPRRPGDEFAVAAITSQLEHIQRSLP